MKLQSQSFMLMLEEQIEIGDLKATLIAQVIGTKQNYDVDFIDICQISYMGIPIDGYDNWRKFKAFHKEMGIDFDTHIGNKFDEIFTKDSISGFINKVKF